MTVVNSPVILPRLIAGYPGRITDIQEMPYGVGTTFPELVDTIARWIPEELIPYMIRLNANNDQVVDLLNKALTDQSEYVMAQLATVLAEIIAGENVELNDGTIRAALGSVNSVTMQFLSGFYAPKLSAAFAGQSRFYAPDPNGTDDNATLSGLFAAMMTANGIADARPGEVILGPGVYKGNFGWNAGFWSGKVKGRGKQATYLQSLDEFKAVVKVTGNSGSIVSGSLEDLTIAGPDLSAPTVRKGLGTELNGIGGFQIERVQYTNLDQGHRWAISTAGQFTEFCVLRDVNMNYVTQPLKYDGPGSYHGSGIEGNSIIGLIQGGSLIEISAGANVYNAPLSLTVFTNEAGATNNTTGNIIVNRYERAVSFYGHFRMEMQGGKYWLGWVDGSYIYYAGTIDMWGGPCRMGKFFLVDKVTFTGTAVVPFLKPWNVSMTLGLGTTPIMGGAPINGPGVYEGSIEVFGPNAYWVSVTVRCWSSGTSIPPYVQVVATHYTNTPGSAGAPVFEWNNGLTVRGATNGYDGSYSVSASYRALVHSNAQDNLSQ